MDVKPLRDEFDCKVIRQQIQDYNYRGHLLAFRKAICKHRSRWLYWNMVTIARYGISIGRLMLWCR